MAGLAGQAGEAELELEESHSPRLLRMFRKHMPCISVAACIRVNS